MSEFRAKSTQVAEEQRQLTARLNEQEASNTKAIETRVKGHIGDQDYVTLKKSITDEFEHIEQALRRLEDERTSVQEAPKIKEFELKNLAEFWQKGDLQYRVDLQFSLAPDGLRRNGDNGFLNKDNPQLFQAFKQMLADLVERWWVINDLTFDLSRVRAFQASEHAESGGCACDSRQPLASLGRVG